MGARARRRILNGSSLKPECRFTMNSNQRPDWDTVLVDIADYVLNYRIKSGLAYETARDRLPERYLRQQDR